MDYLDELLALSTPPSRRKHTGRIEGFGHVEDKLGLVFPSDYKGLIHAYGEGIWFDTIHVFNPFDPRQCDALNSWAEEMRQRREECSGEFEFPVYPEPNGLFPWATFTGIRGELYWLTDGEPDCWPTMSGAGILTKSDLERHDVTATQLLWQFATSDSTLQETRLNSAVPDSYRELKFHGT